MGAAGDPGTGGIVPCTAFTASLPALAILASYLNGGLEMPGLYG
ncbi:MAG TPA: hypothetical protein PK645_04030 [Bacillota bacterium]|jgi:hypothetical protein|nr:hypothetical protein [Bacillota bacterium]HPZ59694.1 hypothetical protein [Bacillota bacterium]